MSAEESGALPGGADRPGLKLTGPVEEVNHRKWGEHETPRPPRCVRKSRKWGRAWNEWSERQVGRNHDNCSCYCNRVASQLFSVSTLTKVSLLYFTIFQITSSTENRFCTRNWTDVNWQAVFPSTLSSQSAGKWSGMCLYFVCHLCFLTSDFSS